MNGGGFLAGLLAILFIGIAMDAQGAGTPDTYSLEAFRLAFLTQVPLWLGAFMIVWSASARACTSASISGRGAGAGPGAAVAGPWDVRAAGASPPRPPLGRAISGRCP